MRIGRAFGGGTALNGDDDLGAAVISVSESNTVTAFVASSVSSLCFASSLSMMGKETRYRGRAKRFEDMRRGSRGRKLWQTNYRVSVTAQRISVFYSER